MGRSVTGGKINLFNTYLLIYFLFCALLCLFYVLEFYRGLADSFFRVTKASRYVVTLNLEILSCITDLGPITY